MSLNRFQDILEELKLFDVLHSMMDKILEPSIWNPTNFMINNVKYEIAIKEEVKQKLAAIEMQLY